jgi:hypothetical protein
MRGGRSCERRLVVFEMTFLCRVLHSLRSLETALRVEIIQG